MMMMTGKHTWSMKLVIPRSAGRKVDAITRTLGSLSETIRTFTLVFEY